MTDYIATDTELTSIANAIRTRGGTSASLEFPDEFISAIYAIDGGSEIHNQNKTVTPTESQQSVTADSGYTGLGTVTVNAISSSYVGSGVTRRSSTDLTASGATVTAPSGYYESSASKAVASGTAGTPTATKGTVSNHSVTVTPSVTNTTGYITGSTKTGTAITVSASELVSGSETKTANGTYDVTNLAELVVNVSGGGGSGIQFGHASLEDHTSASSSVSFTGLLGEPTSFMAWYEDYTITPSSTPQVVDVIFDGTNIHAQTITNTSNAQVTYNNTSFTKSYSNGTLTITSTGAQFQSGEIVLEYTYGGSAGNIHTSDVQVGSGATSITFTDLDGEPEEWYCSFKSNFGTSSGYQRVIMVNALQRVSGDICGYEMDSAARFSWSDWSASYSNGSLTITSNGTNAGGYFHQPGYYQLTYVTADASGNYQSKSVTFTPTTSQQTQTVLPDSGYDALKSVSVTVNAVQYSTIYTGSSAPSAYTGVNGDIYLQI